ncbi:hypothetical protein DL766_006634 [Monosporascus sp. MC13-8B]|nr:hypothetical protein DL763_002326 [Monosporascus cannonballus]RYP26724.1 hypothetical protein DL766_006634 [Monosporascus sp. MC13-8B]
MAAVDRERAAKLISELQQLRNREIQIMQGLYGVQEDKDVEVEGAPASSDDEPRRSRLQEKEPSQEPTPTSSQPVWQSTQDSALPNPHPIPDEWCAVWSDDLLRQRIRERDDNPGCGGDQWRSIPNVSPSDPAVKYIRKNVPRSLNHFTFSRDPKFIRDKQDENAFYVIDFDPSGHVTLDTRNESVTSLANRLFEEAFTPSLLAAVLLSVAKDKQHDYATIYAALRRHLSTHSSDRLHYDKHVFKKDSDDEDSPWMGSVTLPYFALTKEKPAQDQVPRSLAGILGTKGPQSESTVIFDNELRQNLLFDDRNFTNAKKYFWASQCLRVFEDHIVGTLRLLSGILRMTTDLDGTWLLPEEETMQEREVKGFKERIERKRQEIESLNNGIRSAAQLFSASSVSESRFSTEQNGNIRLLTLVTIAYLPLSFAATIYGMDVLPECASFGSFFIVTAILCMVTFVIVFNVELITIFVRKRLFGKAQAGMLRDPNPWWNHNAGRLRQESQNKRMTFPARTGAGPWSTDEPLTKPTYSFFPVLKHSARLPGSRRDYRLRQTLRRTTSAVGAVQVPAAASLDVVG